MSAVHWLSPRSNVPLSVLWEQNLGCCSKRHLKNSTSCIKHRIQSERHNKFLFFLMSSTQINTLFLSSYVRYTPYCAPQKEETTFALPPCFFLLLLSLVCSLALSFYFLSWHQHVCASAFYVPSRPPSLLLLLSHVETSKSPDLDILRGRLSQYWRSDFPFTSFFFFLSLSFRPRWQFLYHSSSSFSLYLL